MRGILGQFRKPWVEKTQNQGLEFFPYKFTAKELDEETGLYYYGARYLDSKYSMWISTDPALGEYIPKAPIDEKAKRYNQNLPGMDGVFIHINAYLWEENLGFSEHGKNARYGAVRI